MVTGRYKLGLLILILLIIFIGCTQTVVQDVQEITYALDDRNVSFSEVSIPFFLIDNIVDVPIIPSMKLIEGIEEGNFKKGLFEIDGIGRVNIYVQDISRKMLLITHAGELYGITPGIGEEFDEFRYNLYVRWELTYK